MASFLLGLIWLLAFLAVPLTVAYRRMNLPASTLLIGVALLVYASFGVGPWLWFLVLWIAFAGLLALNFKICLDQLMV